MVEALISLLVLLLVLCIVYWIAKLAITQFGAPLIVLQIVGLVLLLVFIVGLLRVLGLSVPWPGR